MTEYQLFKLLCIEGKIVLSNSHLAQGWYQKFLSKGLHLTINNNCLILNDAITVLDVEEILHFLPESSKSLSKLIKVVYQATSTNLDIRTDDSNQILLTEYQSAGKGRNNRKWISPVGHNIYLSVKFSNYAGNNISFLPIYISILVVEALSKAGIEGLSIKWPNDLYLYNKKFSGSILDCYTSNSANMLILGLGINVTMPVDNQKEIDQDFTSLSQFYTNKLVNRNYLLSHILPTLYSCLESYNPTLIDSYITRFNKYNMLLGKNLLIKERELSYAAKYEQINKDGSLRVKKNNKFCDLYAADISVRLEK